MPLDRIPVSPTNTDPPIPSHTVSTDHSAFAYNYNICMRYIYVCVCV